MKLLEQLYLIHSPSRCEARMSTFVQTHLRALRVPFNLGPAGLIYRLDRPGKPMVSAHMDQVQTRPCKEVLSRAGGSILISSTGLGADDKNGIWIVLELLSKHDKELNFIFSVQEELGAGVLADFLPTQKELLAKIPYALVFDRRGWGDIICEDNGYGTRAFEKDLVKIGSVYGYRDRSGVFSDADRISKYMSCANLSCGYFDAHSTDEYTLVPALENALEFGAGIVKTLTKRYEIPEHGRWDHSEAQWAMPFDVEEESLLFICPHCYTAVDWQDENTLCEMCGELLCWEEIIVEEVGFL